MRGHRAKMAMLLGITTVALLSCASILGVGDEPVDVAVRLCRCEQEYPPGLGKTTCVEWVRHQLEQAREQPRAEWMQAFAEECADSCTPFLDCFHRFPVGNLGGVSCSQGWQCVSRSCVGDQCEEPP